MKEQLNALVEVGRRILRRWEMEDPATVFPAHANRADLKAALEGCEQAATPVGLAVNLHPPHYSAHQHPVTDSRRFTSYILRGWHDGKKARSEKVYDDMVPGVAESLANTLNANAMWEPRETLTKMGPIPFKLCVLGVIEGGNLTDILPVTPADVELIYERLDWDTDEEIKLTPEALAAVSDEARAMIEEHNTTCDD